jgi:disulfide bond formation protein DsbB
MEMMVARDRAAARAAAYRTGGAALLFAGAVILAALGFEHLGGYIPCPLCLEQRYAYYAGLPLIFLALVMLTAEWPRLAALLFALVALAFLANAGLSVFHAGVEWKFWPGPAECAGAGGAPGSVDDLMKGLSSESGARCDEPQFRFLGLSFAGWNVLASLAVALLAARASVLTLQGRSHF